MNLTEQLLSRREIYHGRIIDVQVDTVSLPHGRWYATPAAWGSWRWMTRTAPCWWSSTAIWEAAWAADTA